MTEALTIDEIEARITGETPIGRAPKVKPWVDLINDDCRVALKELDASSVDAVVTDPPYALTSEKKGGSGPASLNLNSPAGRARVTTGFMGKAWDTGETAFDPAFWQEVMRVLKPGGHVLAFGGSRTYHKIATAIDDAGFEIRDQIQWVYASGFPKSHDAAWDLHVQASRACGVMVEIDHGEPAAKHDLRFVRATYLQTPVYACAECGKVLQPFVPEQNAQAYRAAWSKSEASWAEQPIMEGWGDVETPTRKLRGCEVCSMPLGIFADGAEGWLRHGTPSRRGEIPWQIAEPDGSRPSYRPQSVEQLANQPEAVRLECRAQEFRGHGTALKPAHEPIVMARKPLVGTVATNLAKHGVGALNIDGCRIPSEKITTTAGSGVIGGTYNWSQTEREGGGWESHDAGRWPANIIHDGSDEVLDAFPNAPGQMADASTSSSSRKTQNVYGEMKRGNGRENEPSADSDNEGTVGFKMKPGARRLDSGSAARFFYCAKASKKDREEGNTHPTVKPTKLMRYLCRLVTPPGGTVLDPFMGSGSTGRGAILEGFNFIGIEMSPEYFDIADARIAAAEKAFME